MDERSSGCYIVDEEFNVVYVNEEGHRLYPQLEVGKKCYACLLGGDVPCGPCPVVNQVVGPQTYTDPIRHIAETVDAVELELPGHGRCHALVFSTVGEEERFAATLPTSAEELRTLALVKALTADYSDVFSVNLRSEQITLYRHNGQTADMNTLYHTGLDYSEGIERYIRRHVIPDDQETVREQTRLESLKRGLREKEFLELHYRVSVNGELHYYVRKIARIGEPDSFDHIVVGVACEDEDVLLRRKREELERCLSEVEQESMTGLYTREAFFLRSDRLLREQPGEEFDLIILKLDSLGNINHSYSRAVGDRVIRQVGRLLSELRVPRTCLCYMGDGVFVSVTGHTDADEREEAVHEFEEKIHRRCGIPELSLKWAFYKNISRDLPLDEVYERTSFALSTIRTIPDRNYVEFDRAMIERMLWEEFVDREFDRALAGGEFVAWYQPKYDISPRRIAGAEALVRWIRPNGELITPDRFVPILERSGKIRRLDEHIFRVTCRMLRSMRRAGHQPLPVSVNLSRASLGTMGLAQRYAAVIREYGVEPELVPIEITETAAVRAQRLHPFAEELIQAGFRLHMDDFGSGYSSLATLQVIPFRTIKLDKSLIDFIGEKDGESLLRHTIAYCHETGRTILAEGVETLDQYMFLRAVGCDQVQGYYFSRPVVETTYRGLLEAQGR